MMITTKQQEIQRKVRSSLQPLKGIGYLETPGERNGVPKEMY